METVWEKRVNCKGKRAATVQHCYEDCSNRYTSLEHGNCNTIISEQLNTNGCYSRFGIEALLFYLFFIEFKYKDLFIRSWGRSV